MTRRRLTDYLAVLAGDGHRVAAGSAELRSGQFHDVVLTEDVAYRFPRDEQSRRQLPVRVALLTALSGSDLPAAIPAPLGASQFGGGQLSRPVGRCYAVLARLDGEPAWAATIDGQAAEEAMVTQLAGLLDRLAVLGCDAAVRRAVPKAGPHDWADWAGLVRTVLFPLMSEMGRSRAGDELAAVLTVPAEGDALVHTDLGGSNLLLTTADGLPRLTGILDWDGACVGNQANDLASLAVTFGWRMAELIDARRIGPAGSLIPAARVVAATFALQQALPAALNGDEASLDDGLRDYR